MKKIVIGFLFTVQLAQADWIVENFETPNQLWRFTSFADQDLEPSRFSYNTSYAADGVYSLRLYGNTWKLEDITDYGISITEQSIWQVAIYTQSIGTIQSFGISDGENTLRYILECYDAPPSEDYWISTYAGWKDTTSQFRTYKLPVGRDWFDRYGGTSPVDITDLLYINDEDTRDGVVYFDQILDITDSEPFPPVVDAGPDQTAEVGQTLTFQATIVDPDSASHTAKWDFGDGAVAEGAIVTHAYAGPGVYRVLFCATDATGRTDCDSLAVNVGPDRDIVASLLFGGDCMLARRYEDANEDGIPGNNDGSLILPNDGGEGAFLIGDAGRRVFADYRATNLETPLTNQGTAHPTKSIVFRSRPDSVAGLTQNGIDLVTLANNHAIDYGQAGFSQTLMVLANPSAYSTYARDYQIPQVGGGANQYAAERPATLSVQGLRTAFFGMNSVIGKPSNEKPFFEAGHDKYGCLQFNSYNLQRCAAEAQEMADVQVALLHSGTEYSFSPSSFLVEQASRASELGVDVIIASHPHVVQAVQYQNGTFTAYSMGNYMFDQQYAITMDSFLCKTYVGREGFLGAELIPVFVENYIPKFQQGYVGRTILTKLIDLSAQYETLLLPVGDKAVLITDRNDITIQPEPVAVQVSMTYSSTINSYVSDLLAVPQDSFLKSIDNLLNPPPQYNVVLGQDLLKFGTFEDLDLDLDVDEGTGWTLDEGVSELISPYNPYEGIRCLRLRRQNTHTQDAQVESAQRYAIERNGLYCVSGYIRLVDARNATLKVRWQLYPYGSSSYLDFDQIVAGPLSGSQSWTYFKTFVRAPAYLDYASIIVTASPPNPGTTYSYAYFDELRFIKWDILSNPIFPYQLADTNGARYLAITGSAQRTPTLSYTLQTITAADTDGDGLYDFLEDWNRNGVVDYGESDPSNQDSDGDGLTDWEEWNFGEDGHLTALHLIDSDGDLFTDAQELEAGTSPNDDLSVPPWPTPTFTPTQPPTETPTMTPTLTPTPTNSPTATETFTPTWSPTPTASPIFTVTATPTNSPTIPGGTPSATPTIDPGSGIELDLLISSPQIKSGDIFWLLLSLRNYGIARTVDLYVILEVFGQYYFYPSWRVLEAGFDYRTMFIPSQDNEIIPIITEFVMPPVEPSGPFLFYAAMFQTGFLDPSFMVSNLSLVEFRLGS